MSNSASFIAYAFHDAQSEAAFAIRLRHAERHLEGLYPKGLSRTHVGDRGTGFVGWLPSDHVVAWEPYTVRGDSGVAWLHVPSTAADPESGVDEWTLADSLFSGATSAADIGSPFAVARWRSGQLEIANDVLGLVRLFHFRFPEGEVWSSRPGLAHVFMGYRPRKNPVAWAGMATLGWASTGHTHMGRGRQLPGASRVYAYSSRIRGHSTTESRIPEWFENVTSGPEPTPETNVRDMELYMRTARRWPVPATADLSGGKDSRVVAAVGIRSGAVRQLRTVATDHGEVETAKTLISLLEEEVRHDIQLKKDPAGVSTDVEERLASQHAAWEGRYLAPSGYRAPHFRGFAARRSPVFNGLGGEVMAGGNLLGKWHERLTSAPVGAATDKLTTMVSVALGASDTAKGRVHAELRGYVDWARDLGFQSAPHVMDLFYHFDKMPNWSVTFATPNTIAPLFAPSLIAFAAHRVGNPLEYGEAHRRILRQAMPLWADVPFYKPSASRRAMPYIWENLDWTAVRRHVTSRSDFSESFDAAAIREALEQVDDGLATARHELLLHRFLWESTFDTYLASVERAADACAQELESLPAPQDVWHH